MKKILFTILAVTALVACESEKNSDDEIPETRMVTKIECKEVSTNGDYFNMVATFNYDKDGRVITTTNTMDYTNNGIVHKTNHSNAVTYISNSSFKVIGTNTLSGIVEMEETTEITNGKATKATRKYIINGEEITDINTFEYNGNYIAKSTVWGKVYNATWSDGNMTKVSYENEGEIGVNIATYEKTLNNKKLSIDLNWIISSIYFEGYSFIKNNYLMGIMDLYGAGNKNLISTLSLCNSDGKLFYTKEYKYTFDKDGYPIQINITTKESKEIISRETITVTY